MDKGLVSLNNWSTYSLYEFMHLWEWGLR